MKVLVVPTIRENSIKTFLQAWSPLNHLFDKVIIVEDNPKKTFLIDENVVHVSWKEIEKDLGDKAWIISRRDSAIRSYGFWKAHEMGAVYVFSLDDDCHPVIDQKFTGEHINNLEFTPRWCETILGQRTRGIPYETHRKAGISCSPQLGLTNVVMSVGLWEGVPDFDSVQALTQPKIINFKPPRVTRVLPRGQYFPLCGMNFCYKREATPLCYFPLMGEGFPFGRFDDIWFGIIAKKICDHLDWSITCGMPFVHHRKASDKFANLEREAGGIAINENFWRIVDDCDLEGDSPVDCMKQMGEHIAKTRIRKLPEKKKDYGEILGEAMIEWASLFE